MLGESVIVEGPRDARVCERLAGLELLYWQFVVYKVCRIQGVTASCICARCDTQHTSGQKSFPNAQLNANCYTLLCSGALQVQ